VVDAQSCVTGVEALLRWVHPQRGLISPAQFIPVAEQSGLIFELGQWVLQVACAQLVAWSAQPATSTLTMAVNVGARQFATPTFATRCWACSSPPVPIRTFSNLNFHRALLLSDVEDAVQKMGELRAVGVGFSLDDFGTGYSSLVVPEALAAGPAQDRPILRARCAGRSQRRGHRPHHSHAGAQPGLGGGGRGRGVRGAAPVFAAKRLHARFQGYLFGRPVPLDQLQLGT